MRQPRLEDLDNRDRSRLLEKCGQSRLDAERLAGTDGVPGQGQYIVLQEDDGEVD